jgi:hypothetical protein
MLHSGNRPRPDGEGNKPSEGSGLFTVRSRTIVVLSTIIGVLSGGTRCPPKEPGYWR